jgi:hypothetical protein
MRPIACGGIEVRSRDGRPVALDLGWNTVKLDVDERRREAAIFALADGARSLVELGRATSLGAESAMAGVRALYEMGAIADAGDAPAPALSFFRHLAAISRTRFARLTAGAAGIDSALAAGRLGKRHLLGHLVEIHHFVSSAASHISPAIALAPSEHLRLLFSEYLSEEYLHGVMLREGLLLAGLTSDDIDRAAPLPATRAVMDFLRGLAHTDFLAYSAVAAYNEAPTLEGAVGLYDARWRRIDETGLLPPAALAPFREHELIDLEGEHAALFEDCFCDLPDLPGSMQRGFARTVAAYVHAEAEWFAAIACYYQGAEGPAYFSL